VMDSRAAFGQELSDGRIWNLGLQQLDQRFARGEPGDSGTVCVIQGDDWHTQDVPVEGEELVEPVDRDADVGEARATTGRFLQGSVGLKRRISGRWQGTLRSAGR
jgi:hypothetical protein